MPDKESPGFSVSSFYLVIAVVDAIIRLKSILSRQLTRSTTKEKYNDEKTMHCMDSMYSFIDVGDSSVTKNC